MTSPPHETNLIEFTLAYPVTRGITTVLVGAALALFGFLLLVPFLPLVGYAYRVGRAAARGDPAPPAYDDWTGLTRDGLLVLIAVLPPVLFLGVLLGGVIVTARIIGTPLAMVLGVFASAAVIFTGTYLMIAILPTLIATGSVNRTYNDRTFLKFALTYPYFKGFVFLVVAHLVVSIIASFLFIALLLTIVAAVLVVPLYVLLVAYIVYAYAALWGYVCWDARATIPLPRVEPDATLTLHW